MDVAKQLFDEEMMILRALEMLAEQKHKQKISKRDLAKKADLPVSSISTLFEGEKIELRRLMAIARTLDMRVELRVLPAKAQDPEAINETADIGPGFYVAFGSDLGAVGFFEVKDHCTEGLVVWGLSRWQESLGYRTLGLSLNDWLSRQNPGVLYRRDIDRTKTMFSADTRRSQA
jgi:DNA-binding Xre family transcriptional regulator